MAEKDIEQILTWLKRLEGKIDKIQEDIADMKASEVDSDKRLTAVETVAGENEIAIRRANVERLHCKEEEGDKIAAIEKNVGEIDGEVGKIKKTIKPVKNATTVFFWLKKHWIIDILMTVALILIIVGVATVVRRWPVGKAIQDISLGEIWNLFIDFKK